MCAKNKVIIFGERSAAERKSASFDSIELVKIGFLYINRRLSSCSSPRICFFMYGMYAVKKDKDTRIKILASSYIILRYIRFHTLTAVRYICS